MSSTQTFTMILEVEVDAPPSVPLDLLLRDVSGTALSDGTSGGYPWCTGGVTATFKDPAVQARADEAAAERARAYAAKVAAREQGRP